MGGRAIDPGLRRRVERRAKGRCEYCGNPQLPMCVTFPVDHVIPVTRNGPTTFGNLAFACPWCNTSKGDAIAGYDRTTDRVVPLFNPRSDVWADHFRWSDNGLRIIGKTPTG